VGHLTFQRLCVTAVENDVGAASGQVLGHRGADPSRGSGDRVRPAVEPERGSVPAHARAARRPWVGGGSATTRRAHLDAALLLGVRPTSGRNPYAHGTLE